MYRRQEQLDPRITQALTNCSSSFRQSIYPLIQPTFQLLKQQGIVYSIISNHQQRQCLICLKALSTTSQKWLVITNTPNKSKSIFSSCMQTTLSKKICRVGPDISITIDRNSVNQNNIIIGDINRIIYLIEHQYIKVFLFNGVIFQNLSQLVQNKEYKKLKRLLQLLPKSINKTMFLSKQLDEQNRDDINDF